MRILITGSRDWVDPSKIRGAIVEALRSASGTDHTIIHGCAVGADSMADAIARDLGLSVEPHPANWSEFGKRAGYLRNVEMVESGADICLAFIRDSSRGATMCADIASKAGIPVRRFEEWSSDHYTGIYTNG